MKPHALWTCHCTMVLVHVFARNIARALVERLENPSVGKGAAAPLPTARDEGLGRLLGGAGLGAQELQQFGVDFLCMRPWDAVRTALDDHEARA
jgi:hypothetical protein